MFLITYDPHWQVRNQALSNVAFSKITLPDIIDNKSRIKKELIAKIEEYVDGVLDQRARELTTFSSTNSKMKNIASNINTKIDAQFKTKSMEIEPLEATKETVLSYVIGVKDSFGQLEDFEADIKKNKFKPGNLSLIKVFFILLAKVTS